MTKDSDPSVITIDCHYLRAKFAAAFLIHENGRAVFIENNTTHATPYLLNALNKENIKPENVDYLIVTHAHLDHAGGTSALLGHFPNAKVIAHPKAAKTLSNPEKLIQSAKTVYGEKTFEKLYGKIDPVSQLKIQTIQDGEQLNWQSRTFTFFYTLGHASHHICIHDSKTNGIFTGDTFGLCYPELQSEGLFILPSTSPIDYDPIEAPKSIEKILSFQPKRLYLTHFGEITDINRAKTELLKNLQVHESQYEWAKKNLNLQNELGPTIEAHLLKIYSKHAPSLKLDLELNAQGIAFAAKRDWAPKNS